MLTVRKSLRPGLGDPARLASRSLFVASALCAGLAGCSQAPMSHDEMSLSVASLIEETAKTSGPAGGTQIDVSAGAVTALRQAVEADPSFEAASAAVRQAYSQVEAAQGARRPQVSGRSNLGGVNEFGGTSPDQYTGAALTLTLSQLIYDGGAQTETVTQATAGAYLAEADLDILRNDLAGQAAGAWIAVWESAQRVGLIRQRVTELNSVMDQLDRLAANGMLDRSMIDSARRKIVDISLDEMRLQSELDIALLSYRRFFGAGAAQPGGLIDVISLSEALANRDNWQEAPTMRRAAAEVIAARSAVTQAQAAFRPAVRLQSSLSSPMQPGESSSASVGLMVEYVFHDGGQRQAQLDGAEANAQAVQATLQSQRDILLSQLSSAVQQVQSIDRSMPLVREKVELGTAEAETARSQIATGQSNLRQLIDTEIENYRLRDQLITMQAQRSRLLVAIGSQTGLLSQKLSIGQ